MTNNNELNMIDTLNNLGAAEFAKGNYAEAKNHYEEALSLQQNLPTNIGEPEVLGTFYYSLHDENGETNHTRSAQVVSHTAEDFATITGKFSEAVTVINTPGVYTEQFNAAVKEVINGVAEYFSTFQYHSLQTLPLTDENFHPLGDQSQILWDGARVPAPVNGELFATYKEDGNIYLPGGSISISQIYSDSGTSNATTVPRVVFMVKGTSGDYAGNGPDKVMIVEYDNDGTIFGDGSHKFLRRLRLVKGDWTKL